ncbi:DUF3953 domain-containing protein [Oceanobacillus senegalensis]|uniref:DUF3953 domain-containing protein n=1 Tax=Oceanobacillus senegalensis TaxID=1936063 RepID=UPI000A305FAA
MLLRNFNLTLAILVILLFVYRLIFDSTFTFIFYLAPIMLLSFGIENVKEKRKGLGYFYLFGFFLICLTAISNKLL